jgi:stalled ribosome rescue protein Dom34
MRKRGYRRGYPVAVLIGFDINRAILWQMFSNVVKPYGVVKLEGPRTDAKALYRFHESIVESLRPLLKEGTKSIVLASPSKTVFAEAFLNHVHKHDSWLSQKSGSYGASFGMLVGSAGELCDVRDLVKRKDLMDLIKTTSSADADRETEELERALGSKGDSTRLLYSVDEAESLIYDRSEIASVRIDSLMLTSRYLAEYREKGRLNRLLQVARNKKVKTLIVNADTRAGKRLSQLGGFVCLARTVEPMHRR